jgi:hypothetical protein
MMHTTADETLLGDARACPAPGMALGLVVIGRHGMRAVPLPVGGELVIGRHESCQLALPEPALSRYHARFVGHEASVTVEDLGSRHGTWLSGTRIESALLGVGASVRLADVVVTVSFGAYVQDSAVPEAEPRLRDAQADAALSAQTLRARMALLERAEAQRALAQTNGNQRRAAELLGMPLRTFERRLRMWREENQESLVAPAPHSDEHRLG